MIAAAENGLSSAIEPSIYDNLPYVRLRQSNKILDLTNSTALVDRNYLVGLLLPMLLRIDFDEDYYRTTYEDLREAEASGDLPDLHAHYIRFGFFENRLPRAVEVDPTFYARSYPDVGAAILENRVASCQVHFETTGFAEGRLPRKGWSFSDLMRDPPRPSQARPARRT